VKGIVGDMSPECLSSLGRLLTGRLSRNDFEVPRSPLALSGRVTREELCNGAHVSDPRGRRFTERFLVPMISPIIELFGAYRPYLSCENRRGDNPNRDGNNEISGETQEPTEGVGMDM
jgi:hypothetical protein